jgi:hypothetical protein
MRRIRRNLSGIFISREKSRQSEFVPDQDGWNLQNDKQYKRVRETDNSEREQQQARDKHNRTKDQRPAHLAKRLEPSPCAENPQHAKQPRAGIDGQFQSS